MPNPIDPAQTPDDAPPLGPCGCDDYTPRMHAGARYCQSCDGDVPNPKTPGHGSEAGSAPISVYWLRSGRSDQAWNYTKTHATRRYFSDETVCGAEIGESAEYGEPSTVNCRRCLRGMERSE